MTKHTCLIKQQPVHPNISRVKMRLIERRPMSDLKASHLTSQTEVMALFTLQLNMFTKSHNMVSCSQSDWLQMEATTS